MQTKKERGKQQEPTASRAHLAKQQCLDAASASSSPAPLGSYEAHFVRGVLAPDESRLPCACSTNALYLQCSFRSRAHGTFEAMKRNAHYDSTFIESSVLISKTTRMNGNRERKLKIFLKL